MGERSKKIFLYICIILPFVGYCVYYYSGMIKNAPFRFSDFESIQFSYGPKDSLINKFDSKTGAYQYLDKRDSLMKTTLKLRKDDMLYLHRKATEFGFWNFPDDMTVDSVSSKNTRFYLQFNYKEKSKKMLFDTDYNGNKKLFDASRSVIDEVQRVLNDAEDR